MSIVSAKMLIVCHGEPFVVPRLIIDSATVWVRVCPNQPAYWRNRFEVSELKLLFAEWVSYQTSMLPCPQRVYTINYKRLRRQPPMNKQFFLRKHAPTRDLNNTLGKLPHNPKKQLTTTQLALTVYIA